jgi:general secretion pathway protein D
MKIDMKTICKVASVSIVALSLASCASSRTSGDEYASHDEWVKAVAEYRKDLYDHPNDIEIKAKYERMELQAANYYYHRGMREMASGNLEGAEQAFQQGLASMPNNIKLQQILNDTLRQKEANSAYREGVRLLEAGKTLEAKRRFKRSLEVYPGQKDVAAKLAEIQRKESDRSGESLALSSSAPITLNFRETDIRDAFEFLAKSFGVNVIFDDAVKNNPVTLYAKDITFEQGLNLLLSTSKTFYKKLGPNTMLLSLDSKEKRGQYEDQIVRVFHLNSIRAKEMSDILKGLLTIRKIIINEELNSITVRDNEEVIRLVEKVILASDEKPAEVILEVEILEVSRNKAEKLGLDFGSYSISANVPPYPLSSNFGDAAQSTGMLTVPSATLRFFKQDVSAKTLANPKIRVLNNKAAKILIGDRIPLIATTIQDVTGQIRNAYDYKEVGIILQTEPTIHLDNSVMVKLGLEVSSLGQNLGTAAQPAYSIGSRKAETYMLLRDGETAILGGLIRDEERNTRVRIPGLGDIPLLGALFTSYDDSAGRTDVLLTITPHVVRGWEVQQKSDQEFFSGTENNYSDKSVFSSFNDAADATMTPGAKNGSIAVTAGVPEIFDLTASGDSKFSEPVLLAFSNPSYEVKAGQEFEIELTGQNMSGVMSAPIELLYNPQVMSFVRAEPSKYPAPETFNAVADDAKGLLTIKLDYPADTKAKKNAVTARVIMRGIAPGVSYLTYGTQNVTGAEGRNIVARTRASRVVIN